MRKYVLGSPEAMKLQPPLDPSEDEYRSLDRAEPDEDERDEAAEFGGINYP